jgi:MFS family permease
MQTLLKQRIALSVFFFLSGCCFSTWASRIPTIKNIYQLNEAELGSLLFILPITSLIGLPFSGWLVAKYNTRYPLGLGFILFIFGLLGIAFANEMWLLIVALSVFAFAMRIINIAMNTQSLVLQKLYGKTINGSFHGIWSLGGLVGILFSTLTVRLEIPLLWHLSFVSGFGLLMAFLAFPHLLKKDRQAEGNKFIFGKPDKFILYMGLMVFCAAVCEGGIYDWSGIYFREVVKEDLFTLSYLVFMIAMTISRFFSDVIIQRIGMSKMFVLSAAVSIFGLLLLILVPQVYPALIGFCIAGLGIAAIFPMCFSLSSKSKKYAPGMAISLIGTYATVGMLIGPPIIGYLAHLFNLNLAFIFFILFSALLIPLSRQVFYQMDKQ